MVRRNLPVLKRVLLEWWNRSNNPDGMLLLLDELGYGVRRSSDESKQDRALRGFAAWCLRQVWDKIPDDLMRRALTTTEAYSRGEVEQDEVHAVGEQVLAVLSGGESEVEGKPVGAGAMAFLTVKHGIGPWKAADVGWDAYMLQHGQCVGLIGRVGSRGELDRSEQADALRRFVDFDGFLNLSMTDAIVLG